ncbi:endonuclease [Flavobacterium sp. XGLA_31]|uniref:endonuclease n=1 Tax=Flavobacterium sp. XGLA_31 TaxID=3447666 RepID=UPI003F2D4F93
MKRILTTLLLSFTLISVAQQAAKNTNATASIPPGYYNAATGTGYALKTQLATIISNNYIDRSYSGLYTTYLTSDVDSYYENDGTLLDMYTENPTGPECEFTYGTNQDDGTQGTAECQKYNREHTIPQSYFASATPMYSDAHFVVPSDKYVNAQRADYPYGKVNNATSTYSNGSKKGSNLNSGYSAGYSGVVFEPIDEFKGDIARMLLYFATRYESQLPGFYTASSSDIKVMFDGTSNHSFSNTFLNILLTWNAQDPVSQREIDRNNAVYARQNNRNPYIDNNNYVTQIWGLPLAAPSFNLNAISIYPNPGTNGTINISSEIALDEIDLITINGQVLQTITKPEFENNTYAVTNIPTGFYFLKLTSNNETITKKVLIN